MQLFEGVTTGSWREVQVVINSQQIPGALRVLFGELPYSCISQCVAKAHLRCSLKSSSTRSVPQPAVQIYISWATAPALQVGNL